MSVQLKIKNGMGGSRCGRNRSMKTKFLKLFSKKRRRKQGKSEIKRNLND